VPRNLIRSVVLATAVFTLTTTPLAGARLNTSPAISLAVVTTQDARGTGFGDRFRASMARRGSTRDVDRLVQDASIIRNRAKIQATVDNARAIMSASPSLAALAKSYEITRKRAPRSLADLPFSTPQAEAFAKQLKSQGYRFVGPTSVYAFMQNVGVINDHVHGCFRATDYPAAARSR
jgi:hypothetical protein